MNTKIESVIVPWLLKATLGARTASAGISEDSQVKTGETSE